MLSSVKSAGNSYIRILQMKLMKLKRQEDRRLSWCHGWYCYIYVYVNVVMLQVTLRHDFYNTTFKIEHKFSTASGSASPPPEWKAVGAHLPQTTLLWSGKVTAFLECMWRRKASFDIYYLFIIILYWRQTLVRSDRPRAEGCCLSYSNKHCAVDKAIAVKGQVTYDGEHQDNCLSTDPKTATVLRSGSVQ